MEVYNKNIYETLQNGNKKYILIVYNISRNHYIGLTVYNKPSDGFIYIKSINKYLDVNDLQEYRKKDIKQLVYVKGKFLKIIDDDFFYVLELIEKSLLSKLDNIVDSKNIEDISYIKWCYDKLLLNNNKIPYDSLKQNSIYWIDFGQNVGSELRKLRPAILWRSSYDKKMWTVIPLSTKCRNDKYYFHCDIETLNYGTAKIESMMNLSYKRIREPFFYKNKLLYISKIDYKNILTSIKKYYLFED